MMRFLLAPLSCPETTMRTQLGPHQAAVAATASPVSCAGKLWKEDIQHAIVNSRMLFMHSSS